MLLEETKHHLNTEETHINTTSHHLYTKETHIDTEAINIHSNTRLHLIISLLFYHKVYHPYVSNDHSFVFVTINEILPDAVPAS